MQHGSIFPPGTELPLLPIQPVGRGRPPIFPPAVMDLTSVSQDKVSIYDCVSCFYYSFRLVLLTKAYSPLLGQVGHQAAAGRGKASMEAENFQQVRSFDRFFIAT